MVIFGWSFEVVIIGMDLLMRICLFFIFLFNKERKKKKKILGKIVLYLIGLDDIVVFVN